VVIIRSVIVAPIVSTRRITIIPKVGTARCGDIHMQGVVYEVVMVKSVIRRPKEMHAWIYINNFT